jgi:thymidylate synthase
VICGDDARAAGSALLSLWSEGLDSNGRLPGSRGRFSKELDADALEPLLGTVRVWDLRDTGLTDIGDAIRNLSAEPPRHPPNRGPNALTNPTISERAIFLSRKTTFPIFSSDVGDSWLQLLNLVLKIGTNKQTANGERIAEALNAVLTIETPVLEDGEVEVPQFPDYLDFNEDDFRRLDSSGYSECLRNSEGVDQLEAVCDRLKKSHDTRSGTMVFLEPSDIATSEVTSDLISATFNIIDEKLFGSFVLRSIDVYTDWPIQAMVLVDLQRTIAARLGLETGSFTFILHSAHLYDRDWDRSQRVLKESFIRPLPLHVDPSGVFLFGNDNGSARAMLLNHDASNIMWEDAFSDPEDLSWYIVDVMPWLLPQHIRYVGQECASLMRAMREKECYDQG